MDYVILGGLLFAFVLIGFMISIKADVNAIKKNEEVYNQIKILSQSVERTKVVHMSNIKDLHNLLHGELEKMSADNAEKCDKLEKLFDENKLALEQLKKEIDMLDVKIAATQKKKQTLGRRKSVAVN